MGWCGVLRLQSHGQGMHPTDIYSRGRCTLHHSNAWRQLRGFNSDDVTIRPKKSGLGDVANSRVDPTVGGTHLTDLGMRKQASFWSGAIPKVMTAADATHKSAAAAAAADAYSAAVQGADPREDMDLANMDTAEYLARERAASEAYLADINSLPAPPDGWGAIDHPLQLKAAQLGTEPAVTVAVDATGDNVTLTPMPTPTPTTNTVTVDTEELIMGRPFPGAKRNNTFDRFPISYAPSLRSDVRHTITPVLI